MPLLALLTALLLPRAAPAPPCTRGTETALRGCLATLCRGEGVDRTPPRVRDAGFRLLGCEPPRPREHGQVVTGEYDLYRTDDAGQFRRVTVIGSFARTDRVDTAMSFNGGPIDAAGEAMLRVDVTTTTTFPNGPPGRDGTNVRTDLLAMLCRLVPNGGCTNVTLGSTATFTPARPDEEPLRTHETYRLELGPGSLEAVGPLERMPRLPRDENACRTGTLQEVVDCLQPRCPNAVLDVTPWGLDRAGWYLVECAFAGEPVDDLPGDPTGEVRLYRAAKHRLSYVATLTTLGHAAKRVEDTPMEVDGWQLARVGTRSALRLAWTKSEPGRDAEDTAELTVDTRYATVCLDGGACVTVPEEITQTATPHAGGPPFVTAQRFEVTTDDAGLVVRGPLDAAAPAVQHVPLGP